MRKPVEPQRRDGRDRLLNGARRLLAEKGYAGMELRDVAERGKAPRGSIYHHFPGGKRQLAAEAAELEGSEIRAADRALAGASAASRETLAMFGDIFRRRVGTTPSGSAARSPPPPWPAPRTPPSPPPPPPPSRAGKRRSPPPCATKASAPRTPRPSPASSSRPIEGALLRARAAGGQAPLDSAVAGLEQALEALLAASSGSHGARRSV